MELQPFHLYLYTSLQNLKPFIGHLPNTIAWLITTGAIAFGLITIGRIIFNCGGFDGEDKVIPRTEPEKKAVDRKFGMAQRISVWVILLTMLVSTSAKVMYSFIPTWEQMAYIYGIPAVVNNSGETLDAWGKLPPKMANMIELQMDKVLKGSRYDETKKTKPPAKQTAKNS